MRCENSGSHSFPGRSLLLSTTVLNDNIVFSNVGSTIQRTKMWFKYAKKSYTHIGYITYVLTYVYVCYTTGVPLHGYLP